MDKQVLIERLTKIEFDILGSYRSGMELQDKISYIEKICREKSGNDLIFNLGKNQSELIYEFSTYKDMFDRMSTSASLIKALKKDIEKITNLSENE